MTFADAAGCRELRRALRASMPPEAFEPVPLRGVVGLVTGVLTIALVLVIALDRAPGWVDLALGLVLGQLVTTTGLVAHESLHHSTFRSPSLQRLVGWLAFPWWGFGPGLWIAWHVQAHHGHTQGPGDPDRHPTLADWRSSRLARWVHAVTPGSGTWVSRVSPTFLFTLEAQLFLWYYADLPEYAHVTLDRRRERLVTLLIALGWAALALAIGPWASLCAIVLPMLGSNATLMAYIVSNHWLRPLDPDQNNPFLDTTSVTVPWWMDLLHVGFSYHQEHHVFPRMSNRYAPLLRARLRELAPDAVSVFPLGQVLRELYRQPALYLDDHTLVRADGTGAVSLAEIEARMKAR